MVTSERCIHVVYINDYFPELWKITFPLIEHYAKKVGSDLNVIADRKFPNWHIYYEKMQLHELGKDYEYNFLVDADFLIHPNFPDLFVIGELTQVAFNDGFNASDHYHTSSHSCFNTDPRDLGIATNAVLTRKDSHDLWKPLPFDVETAQTFLKPHSHVDEFCASYNMATNKYSYNGIAGINDTLRSMFIHLGLGDGKQDTLKRAESIIRRWKI